MGLTLFSKNTLLLVTILCASDYFTQTDSAISEMPTDSSSTAHLDVDPSAPSVVSVWRNPVREHQVLARFAPFETLTPNYRSFLATVHSFHEPSI